MPIKKISKEQAAENRKKQEVLRQLGYDIKIDGSWGPWQEEQYRKHVYRGKDPTNASSYVGTLALPVFGQLLRRVAPIAVTGSASGMGLATLPALAATSFVGGIYQDFSDARNGIIRRESITPEQHEQMVYAPDATRVSRPVTSFGISVPVEQIRRTPIPISASTLRAASEDDTTTESEGSENSQQEEQQQKKKSLRERIFGKRTQQQPNNRNWGKWGKRVGKYYIGSWAIPATVDIAGNISAASTDSLGTYKPTFPVLSARSNFEKGLFTAVGSGFRALGNSYGANRGATPQQSVRDTSVINSSATPQQSVRDPSTTTRQQRSELPVGEYLFTTEFFDSIR